MSIMWNEMQLPFWGEGNGTPLQYSCLENPMDGGAWKAAVHGVAEGRTRLNNFTSTFHFHALEKEMATHSSVLDWRIPGTGEPGGLPSVGSRRVGHDWSDLAAEAAVAKLKYDVFSLTARYVKDIIFISVLTFRKIQCTKSVNLLEEWYKYVTIIFLLQLSFI